MNIDSSQLPLRDIHLPDPVSWWPPAPGWWLLLIIVLVFCLGIWLLYRSYIKVKNSITRITKREFDVIRLAFEQHKNTHRLVKELSVLLRRMCISAFPRVQTASLTGGAWLNFLDQFMTGQSFSQGPGKVLIEAPYKASADVHAEDLLRICEDCINGVAIHKRQKGS